MKILFISNDPRIFSENEPVRVRMREYAAAFGELHIVSRSASSRVITEGPLTLHPVSGNKLTAYMKAIVVAKKIIREHGIEVVSAQDPFEHGLIASQAVRGTNAKLHMQVHTDFLSPWFSRESVVNCIRVFLAGITLPKADGIRVVSRRIKDSLTRRFGQKIEEPAVVPLTAEAKLPAPLPLPPHEFPFAFITIGRLEKEKRIDDIIHALSKVDASAGLIVVGAGKEEAALRSLANKLNVSDRVVFTGWSGNPLSLLQSAQTYIQASSYEGYGRTLVEAAVAHVSIISTDVGLIGDVLMPDRDVLVAGVGKIDEIASHMRAFMESGELRTRLSESAALAVEAHVAACGRLTDRVREDLARLI